MLSSPVFEDIENLDTNVKDPFPNINFHQDDSTVSMLTSGIWTVTTECVKTQMIFSSYHFLV